MLPDVGAGRLPGRCANAGVAEKRVEASAEGSRVSDGESSATSDEVEGFAKLPVVRAKEDGDGVDGSLSRVMDAVAEPAADVGDAGIAVDRGEKAEGVNDEAVDARGRVGVSTGEAQRRTTRCDSWISCGARTSFRPG